MKAYPLLFLLVAGSAVHSYKATGSERPIKVVVVAMFEPGDDTGDRPGEFQHWVERFPLSGKISFPQGYRNLRYNQRGVLGIVTGIGTARAASSIMALGMDPRFDLSNAYWLVAGIAGVDPADTSLGSVAWAEWLVDGDIAHQIDMREAPEDWPTGYVPLRKSRPYQRPRQEDGEGVVYHLNARLAEWAFQLTKDIQLQDMDGLKESRSRYANYPNARKPPFVLKGDNMASSTFWHGKLLTDWANDWVDYWTDGEGNFVTSGMEDTGTHQALSFLAQAGKVDPARLLVLRSASNYVMPHEGLTAAESLAGEKKDKGYSGYFPALENAYRVGSRVVDELVANWDTYEDNIPLEK